MRLGLLPTAYIYPRAQRGLRDLLRRRMLLVQQLVQGYWARATGKRLSANAFRHITRQQLADTFTDPEEPFAVANLLQCWLSLQQRIHAIEGWLAKDTRQREDLAALRTIPGVGIILGLTVELESGQVERSLRSRRSVHLILPAVAGGQGLQRQAQGHRQSQMRKPLPGVGMDRSGQLRNPVLTTCKDLVSAQRCAQAADGCAQGCRAQTRARRIPSHARRWPVRGAPRLCLTRTASMLLQVSGRTTQSEEDWPCTFLHRLSFEPAQVVFETVNLRRLSLWTMRRTTE